MQLIHVGYQRTAISIEPIDFHSIQQCTIVLIIPSNQCLMGIDQISLRNSAFDKCFHKYSCHSCKRPCKAKCRLLVDH